MRTKLNVLGPKKDINFKTWTYLNTRT